MTIFHLPTASHWVHCLTSHLNDCNRLLTSIPTPFLGLPESIINKAAVVTFLEHKSSCWFSIQTFRGLYFTENINWNPSSCQQESTWTTDHNYFDLIYYPFYFLLQNHCLLCCSCLRVFALTVLFAWNVLS